MFSTSATLQMACAMSLAATSVLLVPLHPVLPPGQDIFSPVGLTMDEDSSMQEPPVRPGALTQRGTLGFFFQDPDDGSLYASMTGHQVLHIGQDIFLLQPYGVHVGVVVAFVDDYPEDWALIEVDPAAPATPSIRHWTGPSGLPNPGDVQVEDIVCHYGWGYVFEFLEETRHRCGTLAYFQDRDAVEMFRFRGTALPGDSGGPVIHYETGQALGLIVTSGRNSLYHPGGPDICTLLQFYSEHGFDLELATAPYNPPPPDPQPLPIPSEYDPHAILYGTETACFAS